MSFQAMTWAVEQELPALQKLVLLMLANCVNHHTGQCNPSHDRLAKECGMSRDSVKRAISELAEKGLMEIRRQSKDGVNLPNQYVLRVGSSARVVGAVSTHGVGADSTDGRCTQHPGVGADSTTNQEVEPGSKPERHSADASSRASKESGGEEPDPNFDRMWAEYPRREGGDSKKAARKAWNARLREGIAPELMLAGATRYKAELEAAGNIGTRYVKQAATFLGPNHHFSPQQTARGVEHAVGSSWWQLAGFGKEYEAINAGCSERYAHIWRAGARMSDDEIRAARQRGEL